MFLSIFFRSVMKNYINDIKKNISQIIAFPSFEQPPVENAPFGLGVKAALDYFLALAEHLGFKTKNYDGYCGEVIFGEGEPFAILAHLDVVPVGDNWTRSPFGGEIDELNRKIWGRGAMDDKGPAIITLFALKALKDEGFCPKRKIKLIVGCNEETGWKCIDYYKSHAQMPDEGFSPDADFPVIYAEKGIVQIELEFDASGDFAELTGGERGNMVADKCSFIGTYDAVKAEKYGILQDGDRLVARGKSAHGSTPDKGVNAIAPVLKYLGLNGIYTHLFEQCFGLKSLKDETGSLTFSPNVIRQSGDKIKVVVDIRYPASMQLKDILLKIESEGIPCKVLHAQDPLFNDPDCFLISTLCSVYNEITGKEMKPIAIGGGTYARALKCGAAFGPEEEGEESTIHQPDEYITFDKIERCFEIYKLAIERLTK